MIQHNSGHHAADLALSNGRLISVFPVDSIIRAGEPVLAESRTAVRLGLLQLAKCVATKTQLFSKYASS